MMVRGGDHFTFSKMHFLNTDSIGEGKGGGTFLDFQKCIFDFRRCGKRRGDFFEFIKEHVLFSIEPCRFFIISSRIAISDFF